MMMMCPKCEKEMRNGYLFSSKDGAFSFANEVPSALENAKNTEEFVKLTGLKVGGRTSVEVWLRAELVSVGSGGFVR